MAFSRIAVSNQKNGYQLKRVFCLGGPLLNECLLPTTLFSDSLWLMETVSQFAESRYKKGIDG